MCIKTVKVDPCQLENVPDYFNTQKICDDAVREDPYSLEYIPDWFVMQEQVNIWHDDNDNARLVHDRRRKGKDQRNICLVRARVSDSCFWLLICPLTN